MIMSQFNLFFIHLSASLTAPRPSTRLAQNKYNTNYTNKHMYTRTRIHTYARTHNKTINKNRFMTELQSHVS